MADPRSSEASKRARTDVGEIGIASGQFTEERSSATRLLLLGLSPLWLFLLWTRWLRPAEGVGYDPTPLWLENFSRWNPAWLCPVGFAVGLGLLWVRRLRWPLPRPPSVAWDSALVTYLAVQLGAVFCLAAFRWPDPLIQQLAYTCWNLAWLWPWRRRLGWRWETGWPRWVWSGYCLSFAGACLVSTLLHPAPSNNGAVEILLKADLLQRGLWFVQICLLTPLAEEGYYRSLLSSPRLPRLLFSALLFGLVHGDPSGLPQLIWLGLVFGWVRWGAGLPAAVLTHALWNATVFVYLLGA